MEPDALPSPVRSPVRPAPVSERDVGTILLVVGALAAFGGYYALSGHPFWLRMEAFVAGGWLAATAVLAGLLSDGRPVTPSPRRSWLPSKPRSKYAAGDTGPRHWIGSGWWADLGFADGYAAAVVVGLVVAFFAFWLLIEILIPLVGATLFTYSRRAVTATANGASGLAGRPLASLASAALHALVVAAPVGALVYVVHVVRSA